MSSIPIPKADMEAVRNGDPDALLVALAALASKLMRAGGAALHVEILYSGLALEGGTPKAALLAAGMDLRELLAQSPQGFEVLQRFCAHAHHPAKTQPA